MRNFSITILVCILSLVIPTNSFAHAKLVSTIPDANSNTTQSPKQLTLNFNQEVTLVKVRVTSEDGDVTTGFKPEFAAKKSFSISLNQDLADGIYKVSWVAMSKDGHKIENEFIFTIEIKKNRQPEQELIRDNDSNHHQHNH